VLVSDIEDDYLRINGNRIVLLVSEILISVGNESCLPELAMKVKESLPR
jgi:hypothetical protein